MDSDSSVGVGHTEGYMGDHASSRYNQPPNTSDSVEYTPLKEDPPPSLWPTWLMVMGTVLVFFWIWRAANRYVDRERRRRAGIPDEDTRPFSIAYAESALRRRERDLERQRKEQEQAQASQQNSDWSRLGRTISHGQDNRYEARPYLVQRRPATQSHVVPAPIHFPIPDYSRNIQTALPLHGTIESPTISSSDSPPHPPPPVWQDQYAPPAVRAQHDRQRERALAAAATTSSLGRRSRKHLFLDGDSNSEADIPSRVRRRTNHWGASEAIDGDDNAKWVTSNGVVQEQSQRSTRKRGAEGDSDAENDDPRAKSKRKVDADLPSIPGQFNSAISGPGKRKAREDEEATEIDDGKSKQTTKQKKRVRVLSYHESKQGDAEPVDEEMAEQEEDSAPEPVRQPGDEWTTDGKKYKMEKDGSIRILGHVKEETTTIHPGRFSPRRSIKTTIRARWLTPEEYSDAEKAGSLVPGFPEDMITIEHQPLSRAGSEAPSDWSNAVGQTPLKTGGMKTGLGSDRHPPPFSSLPHAGNLTVEQHRLLHLASPARKGKPLRPMGSQSQWERKQAEAKAMEALREARRKAKAAAAPPVKLAATVATVGETSKPAEVTIAPTTSLPTFKVTAPTSTSLGGESKMPAFTLPGTTVSAPAQKEEDKKAEAPKPLFSLGPSAPSTTTAPTTAAATGSTTAPPTRAPVPSFFSAAPTASIPAPTVPFGTTAQPKQEEKKADAPAASGFPFKLPDSKTPATVAAPPSFNFFGPSASGSTTNVPSTSGPGGVTPSATASVAPVETKPAEPPKFSFGFGANAGPSTTSSTTPLFGAAAATQPATATPSTSAPTNIFGSTQAINTDDATKRPSATPLQPSSGSMLFGGPTTTQPTGLFAGSATGGFGTSTGPAFGTTAPKSEAPVNTPSFGFGATTATPTTTSFGGFGSAAPKPADKPAEGGLSILGAAQKAPQSSTPSGFAPPTLFGAQSTSSTAGPSGFGQNNTNGSSTTTAPAFGQSAAMGSSAPTTSAFGQPASTTSAFGQSASSSSAFGQSSGTTTPAFGMANPAPPMSFGQLSANTPTATAFGSSTPAATTTAFGQNATTPGVTTPSVSTFGASGSTSAFGNGATNGAAGSSKPGFSFNFGGNTPAFGGGSGANSAPGTPLPTSAVAPTFNFGAGKPDGTTSPRPTPSTPGQRTFKPLPRARR
ncbi:hypothetical protein FRB90_001941 [Tulasnella sp. 427]|nr:hypothetical protein FRB90_001941 [Tulasnella sp. 427]